MTTWQPDPERLERSAREALDSGKWPHPGSVLGEYMAQRWPDRVPPRCKHVSQPLEPPQKMTPTDQMLPWPGEPTTLICILTPGHRTAHQSVDGWWWRADGMPFYLFG